MNIVDGWLDIAIEMDNLDNTFGPLIAKPWFIVVHGTAEPNRPTAVQIAQDMQRKDIPIKDRKSVHFIIDKDGSLVQQLPITLSAWGNGGSPPGLQPPDPWLPPGNPNNYTISIEHVKWTSDNSETLTPQQQATSFALIDAICKVTGIPHNTSVTDPVQVIAQGGIIGHFNISPEDRKNCPGTFPWVELKNFLSRGFAHKLYTPNSKTFPLWFTVVDDTHWQCKKTGHTIRDAILQTYQKMSMDGDTLPIVGLPITDEIKAPLNANQSITIQICERASFVYDPPHFFDSQEGLGDVYLAHSNHPLILKNTPGLALPVGLPETVKRLAFRQNGPTRLLRRMMKRVRK